MKKTYTNRLYGVKGQGVVEYAGALAVAAILVGSVIASGGGDFSTLFQTALNNAMTTIQGLLPS